MICRSEEYCIGRYWSPPHNRQSSPKILYESNQDCIAHSNSVDRGQVSDDDFDHRREISRRDDWRDVDCYSRSRSPKDRRAESSSSRLYFENSIEDDRGRSYREHDVYPRHMDGEEKNRRPSSSACSNEPRGHSKDDEGYKSVDGRYSSRQHPDVHANRKCVESRNGRNRFSDLDGN